eukprot:SAG25_NODE_552_length_6985_cov_2.281295_4_plen_71_part_00
MSAFVTLMCAVCWFLDHQIALMGGSYERVENERTNAMRRQRAELLLHLGAPRVDDSGCNCFLLLLQRSRY